MRPVLLITAVLAGCLNLIALAEAHDHHGHSSHHAGASGHPSFGQPTFAGRPAFVPARPAQGFVGAQAPRQFFGSAGPGSRFGPRQQLQRSLGLVRVPPLTVLPGTGITTGRQVPFVGRPVRPGRSFVVVPSQRFPNVVRVSPRPAFAPRPGFAFRPAFSSGGLTVISP
jgi:hypothetical protein